MRNPETQTGRNAAPSVDRVQLAEAAAVAAFALAAYAYTYTFEEVPDILAQGIGPAVFPRAVLAIMIFLAALMAFQAVRPSAEARFLRVKYKPVQPIVYMTGGLMLLFCLGLHVIGTIPSALLFTIALSLLWGERRYLAMLIVFSVFAAGIYVLFQTLLGVNLA